MPIPLTELTVIAGCGYLGKMIAEQLRSADRGVLGLTHSESSAAALRAEGIDARACDLTDAAGCRAMAELEICRDREIRVIHCAAAGRGGGVEEYRAVYLDGCRNLRAAFPSARFFFTSSTSVYAQTDGSEVRETSPAEPDRETGRILRLTEDETLAAGGMAGRLAGIYGPGRSVLLKHFLQGQSAIDVRTAAPATPDGRWINQIHAADAARAILHLLDAPENKAIANNTADTVRGSGNAVNFPETGGPARIFNISDSTPLTQRALYTELAARFHLPLPPEAPPDASRKRGWTHKRVSNALLRATGWQPLYPDWFAALDHDPAFLPSILRRQPAVS
ncbi:MAG: NAD-dependent epimerase/dehydratase family protein [Verrucomicrobiota bacterium]